MTPYQTLTSQTHVHCICIESGTLSVLRGESAVDYVALPRSAFMMNIAAGQVTPRTLPDVSFGHVPLHCTRPRRCQHERPAQWSSVWPRSKRRLRCRAEQEGRLSHAAKLYMQGAGPSVSALRPLQYALSDLSLLLAPVAFPLPRSRGGVRGEARSLGFFVCTCGWSRLEARCLPKLKLLVRFLLVVCTASSADKAGWCCQS